MVIRDTTFECDKTTNSAQFPRVELSDSDKMAILESQGAQMVQSYMAPDQLTAYRNFRNMLPGASTQQQQVRNFLLVVLSFQHKVQRKGKGMHKLLQYPLLQLSPFN